MLFYIVYVTFNYQFNVQFIYEIEITKFFNHDPIFA